MDIPSFRFLSEVETKTRTQKIFLKGTHLRKKQNSYTISGRPPEFNKTPGKLQIF